jgi:hypothetical protein
MWVTFGHLRPPGHIMRPSFVTAAGMPAADAADLVGHMAAGTG